MELIEYITDHLHDDKPSLSASSLVCQAWTGPSRHHLFHDLTVRANTKEYARGVLFAKLRDLLESGPSVHVYIRRLFLWSDQSMNQLVPASLLEACYERLPSLHTLSIEGARFPPAPPLSKVADTDNTNLAPQLRTLLVTKSVMDDGLLCTLGHLHSLSKLVLKEIRRYTAQINSSRFHRPSLAHLTLDDGCDIQTLQYFLSSDRANEMEYLDIIFPPQITSEMLSIVGSFLHLPHSQLKDFTIDFSAGSLYDRKFMFHGISMETDWFSVFLQKHFDQLNLVSCLNLRSVQINLNVRGVSWWGEPDVTDWSVLPSILSTTHSGIQHFTLGLATSEETLAEMTEKLSRWDWKPLQTTFTHWDALETVTFKHMSVSGKRSAPEWEEMVRSQLKSLPTVRLQFEYVGLSEREELEAAQEAEAGETDEGQADTV